jgi:hypothetical protein
VAGEFENVIRGAAVKIAQYVEDAASLRVETYYAEIAAGDTLAVQIGSEAEPDLTGFKLAAVTITKLDGDCRAVIPVRAEAGGQLEPDSALLDLHERNVNAAVEYRARVLNALVGALPLRAR